MDKKKQRFHFDYFQQYSDDYKKIPICVFMYAYRRRKSNWLTGSGVQVKCRFPFYNILNFKWPTYRLLKPTTFHYTRIVVTSIACYLTIAVELIECFFVRIFLYTSAHGSLPRTSTIIQNAHSPSYIRHRKKKDLYTDLTIRVQIQCYIVT